MGIMVATSSNVINAKAAGETTYYVSPSGSDTTGNGSISNPWESIGKAKDYIRNNSINDDMSNDIIVYLRGGTYSINDTINFGADDSGSNEFNIKYMNYPGETPIISGGVDLSGGWTLHDSGSNIYKKTGVTINFRQLYVDDNKAVRTRTEGWNSLISWDSSAKTIRVNSSQVSNWNNFSQVEIIIKQIWAGSNMRLSSYTTSGSYVDLSIQQEESDIVFQRPYPQRQSGQQYFFENAYEFIDQEGEWYLDTTQDTLYYKPLAAEDMSTITVVAPAVEKLVTIGGTLDDPAHNIWFYGITFKHSTWLRPSDYGNLDMQAGQYNISADTSNNQYVGRPAASVYIKNANNLRFERNTFKYLGSAAIDFHEGTHDDVFIGNVIENISGTGVYVGVFSDEDVESHEMYNPTDIREISKNELISNNYITKIGQDYYGACGIAAGFPEAITIVHNQLVDLPYTGISVGWGWAAQDNAMKNNTINYNYVKDFMKELKDGGGIYTLSRMPDSVVSGNYIHNQNNEYGALYFDDGSQFITSKDNVLENIPRWLHIWTSSIKDITVDNNYTTTTTMTNNGTRTPVTNTHYYPSADWPQEALDIISGAGIEATYQDIIPVVEEPIEPKKDIRNLASDEGREPVNIF